MADRLTAGEAKKLRARVMASERHIGAAELVLADRRRQRAVVFLECYEAGLSIPEIAEAASRSEAMISIALSDARAMRRDQQTTTAG